MIGTGELFQGFSREVIDTGEANIFVRIGGSGPPLLLLHDYPQTHMAWHLVAPVLAQSFTVIAPDLRGYGRSSCPPSDPEHWSYSKRAMATDLSFVMESRGYRSYAVTGHGRGGRVAARLAQNEPQIVEKLVLLDLIPTLDLWADLNATSRFIPLSWSFLAQPSPLPEGLIARDPEGWVAGRLRRFSKDGSLKWFHELAIADYVDRFAEPDRVHASCEDFRAGATCDLDDDVADRDAGKRIVCPTLLLWGEAGALSKIADPVAFWRPWCTSVSGSMIDCGHWLAEEAPDALLAAMLPFLSGNSGA